MEQLHMRLYQKIGGSILITKSAMLHKKYYHYCGSEGVIGWKQLKKVENISGIEIPKSQ